MLTGSMIEARQDHVELKGVTAHAVQILLDFAYTGMIFKDNTVHENEIVLCGLFEKIGNFWA